MNRNWDIHDREMEAGKQLTDIITKNIIFLHFNWNKK